MNLKPISRKLESAFTKVYLADPSGDAILMPEEPYRFDLSLFEAATTKKEKAYVEDELGITEDSTSMTMNAETCFLSRLDVSSGGLSFYWQSFGPCTFDSGLDFLDFNDGRLYFAHRMEEEYRVVASVSCAKNRELIRKFVYKFIVSNGEDFGVGLFGGLPSNISNHTGGLVPPKLVFKACFDWLEADHMNGKNEKWTLLRQQVVSQLVEPDPMTRSLTILRGAGSIAADVDQYFEDLREEGGDLSFEDKVRILANYFEMSYSTI